MIGLQTARNYSNSEINMNLFKFSIDENIYYAFNIKQNTPYFFIQNTISI